MENFRLLARTRQVTEFSCGASALQIVLNYWGRQVEETELMKLLKTTSEEGSYPEAIANGARELGFDAEVKENLTLDEVRQFTANGNPVIALAQVWRNESTSKASIDEEWENGHYIVILDVDDNYVYFQDPYARMSKAFVPRASFEQHWHHVMGADTKKNPVLNQLGVFIRGKVQAAPKPAAELGSTAPDFRKFGSLNMIVTHFPRFLLPYDFLNELRDIWASGAVRPDAYILLRKDKDGSLSGMEGSGLQDDADAAEINALLAIISSRSIGKPELSTSKATTAIKASAAGDFGLSAVDLRELGQKLAPGHSAIVVLVENIWERKFGEVLRKYAGSLVRQQLMTSEALATAMTELTQCTASESVRHVSEAEPG